MIEYENRPVHIAPTVRDVAGRDNVVLSGASRFVTTGTPVRPGKGGWVPALDGYGEMVAVQSSSPGESIAVARIAVISLNRKVFPNAPCHVTISDIDDAGRVTFIESETGPYLAISQTTVVMDMTYVSLHGMMARIATKLAEVMDTIRAIKEVVGTEE